MLTLERQYADRIQVPSVSIERRYNRDTAFPWDTPTLSEARVVDQVHVRLVLCTLPDSTQQPLQLQIARGADLFVQHHHRREPIPEGVSFIVLMPLLRTKSLSFIPQKVSAVEQDAS